MRKLACLLVCFLCSFNGHAGSFAQDFAVVFINQKTETKYGAMPIDRSLLAKAVENASRLRAKGVVIKFFLDQPRLTSSDHLLAESMSRIPVLLQARIDDAEKNPNTLPKASVFSELSFTTSVSGQSGWVPIRQFSEKAKDICFVDFNASPIPIIESYQGKTVKSLLVCAVEIATGQKMLLQPSKSITIGNLVASLDSLNRVNVALTRQEPLAALEFNDLIDGTLSSATLKGKVVIIAYDGPNIHQVDSPVGRIGAHRLFLMYSRKFYETSAT